MDWKTLIALAGTVVTIVGGVAKFFELRKAGQPRSVLWLYGALLVTAWIGLAWFFSTRDSQSAPPLQTKVSPTPTPFPEVTVSKRQYSTKFLHSQWLENAAWQVDGVNVFPADTPSPSVTVINLAKGTHQILAKVSGQVCTASITAPVAPERQGITLTCKPE